MTLGVFPEGAPAVSRHVLTWTPGDARDFGHSGGVRRAGGADRTARPGPGPRGRPPGSRGERPAAALVTPAVINVRTPGTG